MATAFDFTECLERFPIYYEDNQHSEKEQLKIFKYVTTSVPGPGCDMDSFEEQYCGCSCTTDCNLSDNCSCLALTGINYTQKKLPSHILTNHESKPILECHSMCKCSKECHNRLIQNGISFRLEVFNAELKGLGLRTLEFIQQGSFVCEYAGEILSEHEAKQRFQTLPKEDMNYLIVINEHCASGVIQTFIDPKFKGNIGRLINHSCEPNLTMFPVRIRNSFPKLALFANQDIRPLQELCFNYGTSSTNSGTDCNKRKVCYCASSQCQSFLPFDNTVC